MNPNGNHEKFPKLADGSRDLSLDRLHIDTYLDMEKLLKTGKVKAIGVCNYSLKYLTALLLRVSVIPAVNQIENHPQLPQHEVVDFCRSKGIHVTAYSPLGSTGSPLMELPAVKNIAKKHSTSAGTVLLSYHGALFSFAKYCSLLTLEVARGLSVLAKSVTPSRIEQNRTIIELDEEDILALNEISQSVPERYVYPEFGVNFGFPDKPQGIVIA
jgi:diketogulonate reductase-like aldo/keto reductase